ncbi:hypothetical protein GCM10012320_33220 [Sinomonas cellulolyticus]|uniref:Copper resistance protein CopC n=1 Tax=Sinomonas cellulolyticus TaxID=2801916 RepID=A0ABS1JXV9_9MICC|nr:MULTISPECIES: copper resistance CopC family protein [Sinomonas]MBL0704013.1 copper resistance protein CopC [Sinomonas cellulolyticus]GHG59205.1 hypothetical protein GCM10012320_33220 [Sinomonas sp. KCTC 49339]
MRGLVRLLAVLGLGGALMLPAAAAQAHDVLEQTTPADGSTVQSVPASVVLTFDHTPIGIGTEIQVKDPAGTNQADGAPSIVDGNVTQPIKPGAPAGTYTVVWRVVSADSHPIEGTFTFTAKTAGAAQTGSAAAGQQQPSSPEAASAPGTAAPSSSSSPTPELWIPLAAAALVLIAVLAFLTRRAVRRAAEE